MSGLHSARISQIIAVLVTFLIEVFFAFLGGWTLYDVFKSWGTVPSMVIGGLGGVVLLLVYLYVFILREYAVDAVKVFSPARNEDPSGRLRWASFLVGVCLLMDTFFNIDRMLGLPIGLASKICIAIALELFIFVPLALGKLAHAHINTYSPEARMQTKLVNMVDSRLYASLQKELPNLSVADLLALKAGDTSPLQRRVEVVEADRKAKAENPTAPLVQALAGMAGRQTDPLQAVK